MKLVKKVPAYAATPIIAVTSYAMPEDEARFLNEGFDYYFEKPFDKDALVAQIRRMTGED